MDPDYRHIKTLMIAAAALVLLPFTGMIFVYVMGCLAISATDRPCNIGRGGLPLLVPILLYAYWQTVFFTSWLIARLIGHGSSPWFDIYFADGLSIEEDHVRLAGHLLLPVALAVLGIYILLTVI